MTHGSVVHPFHLFFYEKPEGADGSHEFAAFYPGYNMLFYAVEECFAWANLRLKLEEAGATITMVGPSGRASLTIADFESEWLQPSMRALMRDPLRERRIEGWTDVDNYAFCHRTQDDHVPPSRKLSAAEMAERSSVDAAAVKEHQDKRRAKRLKQLEEGRPTRRPRRSQRGAAPQ